MTQAGWKACFGVGDHNSPVDSVVFSSNGILLASGGRDIRLWDPVTGQQVGEPIYVDDGYGIELAFSPDGKLLAGADSDIRFYDMDFKSWIDKACSIVGRNLTWQEWQVYFPNDYYRVTCNQWSLPNDMLEISWFDRIVSLFR